MSCKDPGLIHSIDPCQVRNHCHGGEFGKRLDPAKDASFAHEGGAGDWRIKRLILDTEFRSVLSGYAWHAVFAGHS